MRFAFIPKYDEDNEKFETLYSSYYKMLYYYAFREKGLSQQDAEDVVQETYVRAYKNLHRIDDAKCPKARGFLFKTAKWEVLRLWHKNEPRSNDVDIDDLEFVENSDSLLEQVMFNLDYEQLKQILVSLDSLDKHLLCGQLIEGHSYKQLAEETGLSEKNVSVKLFRIKQGIKIKLLGEEVR